ncbi:hypothetical protein [Prosthecobacter sp.]|uniref:hypothetical protein n=1 Tax=Prosthecobacter sp. TaxID=1965333 RepID=UPI00378461BA
MKFTWLFWIILACGVLGGTVAGVRWHAEQSQDIVEFRSLAKVVVMWERQGKDGTAPHEADLYGTCRETLESAEMKHRALERVRALNKDLQDQDVDIRTMRTPGSGMINILATGAEAEYTRVFLDALVDEFIAFRKNVREQEQGRVLQHYLQELVTLQDAMEDWTSRLARARTAVPATDGPAEVERLTARLSKLRDQRDDLRTTLRQETLPEERPRAEQELKAVERDVSGLEVEIKRLAAALQELHDTEGFTKTARTRYEAKVTEVEAVQKEFTLETDLVALHAHATPASMTILRETAPVILSGFLGAAIGGVIGLAAALIASWRPSTIIPIPS